MTTRPPQQSMTASKPFSRLPARTAWRVRSAAGRAHLGADVLGRTVAVAEVQVRRDRDEAVVREFAGALAVPLVPARRVVDDDHARERTGAERSCHVRVDGVAVVALHGDGFGDHAFVLIGLVRVRHVSLPSV